MKNYELFLKQLQNVQLHFITNEQLSILEQHMSKPDFNVDIVLSKSNAMGLLTRWVTTIYLKLSGLEEVHRPQTAMTARSTRKAEVPKQSTFKKSSKKKVATQMKTIEA